MSNLLVREENLGIPASLLIGRDSSVGAHSPLCSCFPCCCLYMFLTAGTSVINDLDMKRLCIQTEKGQGNVGFHRKRKHCVCRSTDTVWTSWIGLENRRSHGKEFILLRAKTYLAMCDISASFISFHYAWRAEAFPAPPWPGHKHLDSLEVWLSLEWHQAQLFAPLSSDKIIQFPEDRVTVSVLTMSSASHHGLNKLELKALFYNNVWSGQEMATDRHSCLSRLLTQPSRTECCFGILFSSHPVTNF